MEINFNSRLYQYMSKLAECMILSLLWLAFSLPVITFGAATSALYYCAVKVLRKDEGSAFKDFWRAFKSNLNQGVLTVLFAAAICILVVLIGSGIYAAMPRADVLKNIYVVYIIIFSFGISWLHYVFSYIARFEASFRTVLKNSLIICVMNLPASLSMVILFIAVIAVLIMTAPASSVALFLLPALYALVTSFLLEKVYRKYMPAQEPVPNP